MYLFQCIKIQSALPCAVHTNCARHTCSPATTPTILYAFNMLFKQVRPICSMATTCIIFMPDFCLFLSFVRHHHKEYCTSIMQPNYYFQHYVHFILRNKQSSFCNKSCSRIFKFFWEICIKMMFSKDCCATDVWLVPNWFVHSICVVCLSCICGTEWCATDVQLVCNLSVEWFVHCVWWMCKT